MSLCGLGISCEPAPCMHGKDSRKEICHLCDIHKQIMALTDMYKSLSVRVMGQHDFKLNQIDANKKLDKRVLQLDGYCIGLESRIEKIEELKSLDKKPHKCPVCEGLTFLPANWIGKYPESMMKPDALVCKACEGKGIVWG